MPLSASDQERLDALLQRTRTLQEHVLGYPCSRDFDSKDLLPFFEVLLNNIGDPFHTGTWKVDSRDFEREVLEFFAELFRAPPKAWWGYVTNGGTEGNLYGLYLARELHPKGVVYYSRESHYSVAKNLHFLGMRSIMIRSLPSGAMDLDDLRETLRLHRDAPPIIFANIGTTVTEGRDDIAAIRRMIDELAIPSSYIHSDAALSGGYLPFVEPRIPFDFADGADSISVSGHKFMGSPFPCGIVLARKANVDRIGRSIAYIGNIDTTVTGSRNGHSPLILWHRIRSLGVEGLRQRAQAALAMAEWTVQRCAELGIPAWRNPNALTVVIPPVPEAVRERWQIASTKEHSHLITMPGVSRDVLEAFFTDYLAAIQNPESPE